MIPALNLNKTHFLSTLVLSIGYEKLFSKTRIRRACVVAAVTVTVEFRGKEVVTKQGNLMLRQLSS